MERPEAARCRAKRRKKARRQRLGLRESAKGEARLCEVAEHVRAMAPRLRRALRRLQGFLGPTELKQRRAEQVQCVGVTGAKANACRYALLAAAASPRACSRSPDTSSWRTIAWLTLHAADYASRAVPSRLRTASGSDCGGLRTPAALR